MLYLCPLSIQSRPGGATSPTVGGAKRPRPTPASDLRVAMKEARLQVWMLVSLWNILLPTARHILDHLERSSSRSIRSLALPHTHTFLLLFLSQRLLQVREAGKELAASIRKDYKEKKEAGRDRYCGLGLLGMSFECYPSGCSDGSFPVFLHTGCCRRRGSRGRKSCRSSWPR